MVHNIKGTKYQTSIRGNPTLRKVTKNIIEEWFECQ
jgi:hypothetical protein